MTNRISAAVFTDGVSVRTNETGAVGFVAFTNKSHDAGISIAEIMTCDEKEDPTTANWKTNAYVVARTLEPQGNYKLTYFPVGELSVSSPDNVSLDVSLVGVTSNKLEIYGFAAATNTKGKAEKAAGRTLSDKIFARSDSGFFVPVKDGNNLKWLALGNYNLTETLTGLKAEATTNAAGEVQRQFEIANWSTVTNMLSAYAKGEETLSSIQWGESSGGQVTTASSNLVVLVKDLRDNKLKYVSLGTSAADQQSMQYALSHIKTAEGELSEVKAVQLAQWSSISNIASAYKDGESKLSDYLLDPSKTGDFTTNLLFLAKDLSTNPPTLQYVPFGSIPVDTNSLEILTTKDVEGVVHKSIELHDWSSITQGWVSANNPISEIIFSDSDATSNLVVLAKNLTTEKLEYITLGSKAEMYDKRSINTSTNLKIKVGEKVETLTNVVQLYKFDNPEEVKDPNTGKAMTLAGAGSIKKEGSNTTYKVLVRASKPGAGDDPESLTLQYLDIGSLALTNVDNLSVGMWDQTVEGSKDTNSVVALRGFHTDAAGENSLATLAAVSSNEAALATLYELKTNLSIVVRHRLKKGDQWGGTEVTNDCNVLSYLTIGDMSSAPLDRRSLETTAVDENGRPLSGKASKTNVVMQIYGFAQATNESAAVGESFADKVFSTGPSDYIVPVKKGANGPMEWVPLSNYTITETNSGMNVIVASNRSASVDRWLTLANWQEQNETNRTGTTEISMSEMMLTPEEATNILILAKNVDDGTLNYIRLGKVYTDDKSIMTRNISEEGQKATNGLALVGFKEAAVNLVPYKQLVKVDEGGEEEYTYTLGWTNVLSRNADELTVQIWREADHRSGGDSNETYMINGFVQKEAEDKDFSEIVFDDPDESSGKLQVLARKMQPDSELDGTTNGFELVYIDLGNADTNDYSKSGGYRRGLNRLRRSIDALTNQLFGASGFTNTWNAATNDPYSVFDPGKLYDNATIWTNGSRLAELKGAQSQVQGMSSNNPAYLVPVITYGGTHEVITGEGESAVTSSVNSVTMLWEPYLGPDYRTVATNGNGDVEISGAQALAQTWPDYNDSIMYVPVLRPDADFEDTNKTCFIDWAPYTRPDDEIVYGEDFPFIYTYETHYQSLSWGSDPYGNMSTGVIQIAGFMDAATNTVPVKVELKNSGYDEAYAIEWRPFAEVTGALDEKSIGTNDVGATEIKGFKKAGKDQIPVKPADGENAEIEWRPYVIADGKSLTTNDSTKATASGVRATAIADAITMKLSGYEDAGDQYFPYRQDYEGGDSRLMWRPFPYPDGSGVYGRQIDAQIGSLTLSSHDPYGLGPITNVQVVGFWDAEYGTAPVKKKTTNGKPSLKWVKPGTALRIVGTDNGIHILGTGTQTNGIHFTSGSGTVKPVSVTVKEFPKEQGEDGSVNIDIVTHPTTLVADAQTDISLVQNDEESGIVHMQVKGLRPFDLTMVSTNGTSLTMVNCVYMAGGQVYEASPASSYTPGQILCLSVNLNGDQPAASYKSYATLSDVRTAQRNSISAFIYPLYRFGADHTVQADYRSMPVLPVEEFKLGD